MINVSAQVKQAKKELTRIQRKQIPFALSNTINELAFESRTAEMNSMRQQVDRPIPFTQKGFQVQKSTKATLHARLLIPANRWKYIQKIAKGGASTRAGNHHAVPINKALENKYGNLPRNKSRTLGRKKDHFTATINGRAGLWKQEKNGRLSLQIVYKQTTQVPKSYTPWRATERLVISRFPSTFDKKMRYALKTAK